MRSKLPSTILLLISASVSAQKVHWDGPEGKTIADVGVINAQGTTNWVKFNPAASEDGAEEGADSGEDEQLDLLFEQTAMLEQTGATFQDADWVQIWTCAISVAETSNNICYHGEYFQKDEFEIQSIVSVFETTATPDIQGNVNPREIITATGGFKIVG